MFVFRLGVTGAAIATSGATVLSALVMLICLRRPGQGIEVGPYAAIRRTGGSSRSS
jgi:Na+-driven multidrug efflux pump